MTRASASSAAVALGEIERILYRACGLVPSPGLRRVLPDGCLKAARALAMEGPEFLARLYAGEARCVTALVEASVVAETYFFRHPEQFELLRAELLVPAGERPLAAWSAGCATGEEAYSVAMAMLAAGRGSQADRVVATDVSARSLRVAREGAYGPWSLRKLDPGVRRRWFDPPSGREARVVPVVRERVEFRVHNLLRDPPPAEAFDLVVCRNVLIYFDPPTAAAVAAKLLSAVRPGGLLLLGPVEAPFADGLDAIRIDAAGTCAWRRVSPGAARPRARRPTPVPARPARPRPVATPAAAPAAPAGTQPAPPAAPAAPRAIDAARAAARRGDLAEAERIARDAAMLDLCPESWLLLAQAAESRGDVPGAVDAARKALYLDPELAMAHAALVPLYARLGLPDESSRARRNALRAIEDVDDDAPLRGADGTTAGALRLALGETARGTRARAAGEKP